jgi:hypothetical protein
MAYFPINDAQLLKIPENIHTRSVICALNRSYRIVTQIYGENFSPNSSAEKNLSV